MPTLHHLLGHSRIESYLEANPLDISSWCLSRVGATYVTLFDHLERHLHALQCLSLLALSVPHDLDSHTFEKSCMYLLMHFVGR